MQIVDSTREFATTDAHEVRNRRAAVEMRNGARKLGTIATIRETRRNLEVRIDGIAYPAHDIAKIILL